MAVSWNKFLKCILLAVSIAVLALSYYFQWVMGLSPCPLCLMQRFCIVLLVFIGILECFVWAKKNILTVYLLECIVIALGLYFSSRQLWLQSLPKAQLPACMPDLSILLKYFPWQDMVRALVWGGADCAKVEWQFLGLSMAGWSWCYFLLMGLVVLGLILKKSSPSS